MTEQLDFVDRMKGAEALPPWFLEWVHEPAGREISGLFIKLSCGIKNRGYAKYSHWAIAARIRWHMDLKYGPDASSYKVNNNCLAYLARFAVIREPRLAGFFEFRKLGSRKVHS